MNQCALFSVCSNENQKPFLDILLSRNDIKGIVNYLSKLPENEFTLEVLRCGYHLISFKKHGRDKVIQNVIEQINKQLLS
jgi:hypothetical protein